MEMDDLEALNRATQERHIYTIPDDEGPLAIVSASSVNDALYFTHGEDGGAKLICTIPHGATTSDQVSDGYHTFGELYAHRHALFCVVLKKYPFRSFKTRRNDKGEESPGWFIAGVDTPYGQITYHMPELYWEKLPHVRVIEQNDRYDGHSAADVVERLLQMSGYFGEE